MPPNADDSIEAVHRKKKHYHEIKYPETTPEGVRQKGFINGRAFTVIHGRAYDVSEFMESHPGGRMLLSQAIGRDATSLFESYHLRNGLAEAQLAKLPQFSSVPATVLCDDGPFPSNSTFYMTIKRRVLNEVLGGRSQRGGLGLHILASCLIWLSAYCYYATANSVLSALIFGLAGAHIGMTLNHCANHGGLTSSPSINFFFGFANDLIGGSSLIWSYHHHISHHIYTNSVHRDQDVFSAFPLIRFDKRLPKAWYHAFQYIYMGLLFPFLFINKHISDVKALIRGRTAAIELVGASPMDYTLAFAAKAIHLFLVLVVPVVMHGTSAIWIYFLHGAFGSVTLAWLFAISHNLDEAKLEPADPLDWAAMQVAHSANYGGFWAGLATGGLNLQIEHHLFPALAYKHYPAVSKIVREECRKHNVPYNSYDTLPAMIVHFVRFMKHVGEAD